MTESTHANVLWNTARQALEEPQMTYHFYENWTVRPEKAKIHFSRCPWCNNGKGTKKPKVDKTNGTWHGPFATFQEAFDAARCTGKKPSTCGHCKPR